MREKFCLMYSPKKKTWKVERDVGLQITNLSSEDFSWTKKSPGFSTADTYTEWNPSPGSTLVSRAGNCSLK